ncbi:EamA family transporter [Cellulomonas sp. zg-ZUI222]|uniref:EamA family transporter n=1 Tax=Cellulomonas wangleii TaxID=2816956 RepID=UPI001A951AD9|nr:EamA family transporter [Cellulomonas wangleii]MBO0921915.1 EamA family transporter [Cellulomonas wangleii]
MTRCTIRGAAPDRAPTAASTSATGNPLPLLALSLVVEGPARIAGSFDGLGSTQGLLALGGLAFTVVVATLVGSGLWTTLMGRHPSSTVAPFSMLVPVVGIGASWLLLRERTSPTEPACGALVVAGVLLGSTRGSAGGDVVEVPATPSARPLDPSPASRA